MPTNSSVLALDVGSTRVGVAVASLEARLASPLTTLLQGDSFLDDLMRIIAQESVSVLVIGLPRGLDGQETDQTASVKDFAGKLKAEVDLPVHFQDEAVTSKQAEDELKARGKGYEKSEIDALAATYILEDWLSENKEPA